MHAAGIFLAVLLIGQTTTNDAPWVEKRSKDGKFSFAMPVDPVEKIAVQSSPKGSVEVLEYSASHDDCLYKIEKAKSPAPMPAEKLEGALGAVRDSIAKKVKLLSDEATTVAGWPARKLLIEAPLRPGQEPSQVAMLICYVDSDYYQIRVFADKPGAAPKAVDRFFASVVPTSQRPSREPAAKP